MGNFSPRLKTSRDGTDLQLLEMKGVVDYPPVNHPFLALECRQPVSQQPLDPSCGPRLPELALLVRQDLSHQFRVTHDHSRFRPQPGHGDVTCHFSDPLMLWQGNETTSRTL
jgi:hypothetical protein